MTCIDLSDEDWGIVLVALYREAGEVAASEARRTGGLGWASAGKSNHVDNCHRIRDTGSELKMKDVFQIANGGNW